MMMMEKAVSNPIGAPALGFAFSVVAVYVAHELAGLEFGPEVSAAVTTIITYITQRVISRF